jgi:hypothetical protein
MFAGQSREQMRRMYLEAWRKFSAKVPLEPLEAQIAAVVAEHPEYIPFIESGDTALGSDFRPEGGAVNPFLHLGLHLAIREQVATNRPAGIRAIYESLTQRHGTGLEAEHAMLDALAETIWESQRNNVIPDEQAYLEKLKRI